MNKYSSVVEKSASWLEANRPNWASAIDLDRLDMQSTHKCILGQLYGDFWKGLEVFSGDGHSHLNHEEWFKLSQEMGFNAILDGLKPHEHTKEFELLTEAWEEKIRALLHPKTSAYQLILTADERRAFDWVGNRYDTGEPVARILRQGDWEGEWEGGETIAFNLTEPQAWNIKERSEQEDNLWPCFGDALKAKMQRLVDSIV